MEGGGGETTVTQQEAKDLLLTPPPAVTDANVSTIELSGGSKYSAAVIANYVQMNIADFNKLNPNFDRILAATATDKTINLRLPADKVLLFQANKPQILEQSMRLMLSM
jgi:membrane-bound lytic murein transglycosylase D